jgi:hypothetical protein
MFLVVVFVLGRLPCKFHGGYHGDILVLFRAGYRGGMIGNNTGEVLFLFLLCSCSFLILFIVLTLVPGRSQALALRKSYSDDCSCSYFLSLFLFPNHKNIVLVCYFPLLLLLFRAGHR